MSTTVETLEGFELGGPVPVDVALRSENDPSGAFAPGSGVGAFGEVSDARCRTLAIQAGRGNRAAVRRFVEGGCCGRTGVAQGGARRACQEASLGALAAVRRRRPPGPGRWGVGDDVMTLEFLTALPDLGPGIEGCLFCPDEADEGLGLSFRASASVSGGGGATQAAGTVAKVKAKLEARQQLAAAADRQQRRDQLRLKVLDKMIAKTKNNPAMRARLLAARAKVAGSAVRAAKVKVIANQMVANNRAQILLGKAHIAAIQTGKPAAAKTTAAAFLAVGQQNARIKKVRAVQKQAFAAEAAKERAGSAMALAKAHRAQACRLEKAAPAKAATLRARAVTFDLRAREEAQTAQAAQCRAGQARVQLSEPERQEALNGLNLDPKKLASAAVDTAIAKVENAAGNLATKTADIVALPKVTAAVATAANAASRFRLSPKAAKAIAKLKLRNAAKPQSKAAGGALPWLAAAAAGAWMLL